MAELPETIKIGPYTYQVDEDKDVLDSVKAWGYIQSGPQRISIDPTATGERQRVTLLHEVLHGIHMVNGLEGSKWEEDEIERDTPYLLMVLRENPDLVDFLLGDD